MIETGYCAAPFNHLCWAEALISERLGVTNVRGNSMELSHPAIGLISKSVRSQRDRMMEDWSGTMRDADLKGMLFRDREDDFVRIEKPKSLCAIKIFDHQPV